MPSSFHGRSRPRDRWIAASAGLLALLVAGVAIPVASRSADASIDSPLLNLQGSAYPEATPDHFMMGGPQAFPGSFAVGFPELETRELEIIEETTESSGDLVESVGEPRQGRLINGMQLEPGEGYHIRHPKRTWGTRAVVNHLRGVLSRVHRDHADLHPLAVGDLSTQEGGRVSGHTSHQSGRDVDLGLYYRRPPPTVPDRFARATRDNLHFRATWNLLKALAETTDSPTGVQWIMLDYRIQGLLFDWAASEGVDQATLDRMFQYPRGRRADAGLIRHFPGHDNHLHIRFKCPQSDRYCR